MKYQSHVLPETHVVDKVDYVDKLRNSSIAMLTSRVCVSKFFDLYTYSSCILQHVKRYGKHVKLRAQEIFKASFRGTILCNKNASLPNVLQNLTRNI
jgi:hypothetical protein